MVDDQRGGEMQELSAAWKLVAVSNRATRRATSGELSGLVISYTATLPRFGSGLSAGHDLVELLAAEG